MASKLFSDYRNTIYALFHHGSYLTPILRPHRASLFDYEIAALEYCYKDLP